MDYTKIREKDKQFLSLTSLTVPEFDALLPRFEYHWERFINKFTLSGKPRKKKYVPRAIEGLLKTEEKLFFILTYLKNNPLQEFHAASFNLEQDMCNKWIHLLSPIVSKALEEHKAARNEQALNAKLLEGNTYIGDATERPINRPLYNQEEVYSGKKKQHTLKNFLLCCTCGFVVFLGQTTSGRIFDKKIAEKELACQKQIELLMDLGFKGLKIENADIKLPHKKPPKKELTKIQKKENQLLSSIRVTVEHVIGHIKILRIVKDKNRNTKHNYRDFVMDVAVRLHNFRVHNRRITLLPDSNTVS
jgi:DDE superfamily endonuclease/Helix-turn-helix of DDE superfamily endonuclease